MALLGPDGQPTDADPSTEPATGPEAPATETQDQEPQAPNRVVTAFLVFQLPNGQWLASEDIAAPIVPTRKPLPDDIIAGTANVSAQMVARKTADLAAKLTVQTQMAVAQQMQEAQQNAAVLQGLAGRQVPPAFRG